MTPELEALITRWASVKTTIEAMRAEAMPHVEEERKLREQVMTQAFPDAKEGTNTFSLPAGWSLKGTVKVERKVDEAALLNLASDLRKNGISPDKLIRLKYELELKEYRALTAEQQKLVDQALVVKPAAPTLELVAPKESK